MLFLITSQQVSQFFVGITFLLQRRWTHNQHSVNEFVPFSFAVPFSGVEFARGKQSAGHSGAKYEFVFDGSAHELVSGA
jgi:hypothetical protein